MGAIIWQKVTTCNTTGGATVMGSFPYPRNGIIKLDYEFILIFKKLGQPPKVSKEIRDKSRLSQEEWNSYFYGHWNFAGEKQDKHLAMFPEELPRRLIKMFTFIGDTVLDPFLGSGTTTLSARKLERNSIGYEINELFLPIIREKVGLAQKNVHSEIIFEVIKQEKTKIDFQEEIKRLPYIFKDPIKFDKKIDPKKLGFGSKIDNNYTFKESFYSIKEIINPETLVLNNDLKVRLIGIREKPENRAQAMNFLKEISKGQKVFLKFDAEKYDEKNNLLCYLYLKNKTFINAHLIKNNLADVDTSFDYRFKEKFIQYAHSV